MSCPSLELRSLLQAFYGHVHDYEHFYPAFNLTSYPGCTGRGRHLNPAATVHVTTGTALISVGTAYSLTLEVEYGLCPACMPELLKIRLAWLTPNTLGSSRRASVIFGAGGDGASTITR